MGETIRLKGKFSKKLKNRRVRLLIHALSLIFAFLIQTSVFPLIPFLAESPNLLLVLTFSFGFLHGNLPGMLYGLFAGLLMDMFYSGPFGFYSFIFLLIGYFNGFFNRFYYEEYLTLPIFLCVFSELIYHLYIYTFRFLVRARLDLPYYFAHIIFPSTVFSLIVTVFLYRFFFSANRRMVD